MKGRACYRRVTRRHALYTAYCGPHSSALPGFCLRQLQEIKSLLVSIAYLLTNLLTSQESQVFVGTLKIIKISITQHISTIHQGSRNVLTT